VVKIQSLTGERYNSLAHARTRHGPFIMSPSKGLEESNPLTVRWRTKRYHVACVVQENSIVGNPPVPLVSQITPSIISSLGQIISISLASKISLVFLVNRYDSSDWVLRIQSSRNQTCPVSVKPKRQRHSNKSWILKNKTLNNLFVSLSISL
jgi:hypothetical protein